MCQLIQYVSQRKYLLKSMENYELRKTINATAGSNNFYITIPQGQESWVQPGVSHRETKALPKS